MRRGWYLVFLLASLPASVLAQGENTAETDVSVITAADIAHVKPASMPEMLTRLIGLDENNSVISMRGVRGIAVVVDGFVSSVSELSALRPEQVERIEVLRGAASARFGAEAMGGAIAVTTRRAGGRQNPAVNLTQGLDSRGGSYTRVGGSGERAELNGLHLVLASTPPAGGVVVSGNGRKTLQNVGYPASGFERAAYPPGCHSPVHPLSIARSLAPAPAQAGRGSST